MKRFLTIAPLLLLAATLWAQNDSLPATAIAQDDTARFEEVEYKAPNRNPIYYFGSPFASHFAECNLMLGTEDLGVGATYTYLPEVWGGHITGIASLGARWLMAGADYRLSKPWNSADWHLYGSVGCRYGTKDRTLLASATRDNIGFGPAVEVGVRVAGIPTRGSFCITSANVGVLTDMHNVYVTLGAGFSCTLALLASTILVLGL